MDIPGALWIANGTTTTGTWTTGQAQQMSDIPGMQQYAPDTRDELQRTIDEEVKKLNGT